MNVREIPGGLHRYRLFSSDASTSSKGQRYVSNKALSFRIRSVSLAGNAVPQHDLSTPNLRRKHRQMNVRIGQLLKLLHPLSSFTSFERSACLFPLVYIDKET